eukprot:2628261-Rhodomonas_salina.1
MKFHGMRASLLQTCAIPAEIAMPSWELGAQRQGEGRPVWSTTCLSYTLRIRSMHVAAHVSEPCRKPPRARVRFEHRRPGCMSIAAHAA